MSAQTEYDRITALPESERTAQDRLFLKYHQHIDDVAEGRTSIQATLLGIELQVHAMTVLNELTDVGGAELKAKIQAALSS